MAGGVQGAMPTGIPGLERCRGVGQHRAVKKKGAIALFSSITLLFAGYVAWCTHWIWMDAPVPELLEIPAEYRGHAQELVVEHGLTKRDPFPITWNVVWVSLQRPYEIPKMRGWIRVISSEKDGSELQVMRMRGIPTPEDAVLTFNRERTGWSLLVVKANGEISAKGLEKRGEVPSEQ